jgi:peptidoglycan-associated lipoprotein
MKRFPTSLVTVIAAAVMAACSSTPPAPTPAATAPAPVADTVAKPADPSPTPASTVATVVVPAHKDPKSAISTERSVYFEYDDFSVKKDFAALLERHARYLAENPSFAIRIEGNADERGSAEYNLALGQKRAQAVVSALKIYGVKDVQMEPVSFGEERPKGTTHDEAGWSQNRRADIAYR